MITLSDLERINDVRRRDGKPTLTKHQAEAAVRNRRESHVLGYDMTPYLINVDYSTLSVTDIAGDSYTYTPAPFDCSVDSN